MKNKGGRGRNNNFSTVVMRVPLPLRLEFETMITNFYASQKPVTTLANNEKHKPVTSLEVPASDKPVTSLDIKIAANIDVLGLSDHIVTILRRRSINTVFNLIAQEFQDKTITGITRKYHQEICTKLKQYTTPIESLKISRVQIEFLRGNKIETIGHWVVFEKIQSPGAIEGWKRRRRLTQILHLEI